MLKIKEKMEWKWVYRLIVLALIASVALYIVRVVKGPLDVKTTTAEKKAVAKLYTPGSIYDREGKRIVHGIGKEAPRFEYDVNGITAEAYASIIGLDMEMTGDSRFSVIGAASPYLYGMYDSRVDFKDLLRPNSKRVGGSVKLTLDSNPMTNIYQYLKNNKVTDATVLVSNYETGEILAAIDSESYRPTKKEIDELHTETVYNEKKEPVLEIIDDSRAYPDAFKRTYKSGSTQKLAVMIAAIEAEPELCQSFTYNCFGENDGIKCVRTHGKNLSLEKALAVSCNGAFVELANTIGMQKLLPYLKKLGINTEVTYSDQLAFYDSYFTEEHANKDDIALAAIGQGDSFTTPLGVHSITTAIFSDGILKEPYIIDGLTTSEKEELFKPVELKEKQVCSKKTANVVQGAMKAVTQPGGTLGRVKWPDRVTILGKSGTAQNWTKYTGEQYNTIWFTGGIENTDEPIAITVVIDHVDKNTSSTVAAGVANDIIKNYILK